MRFILGLFAGTLVGAATAVLYSNQTGVDLGKEFERVRADVQTRDFDALSGHLDMRFKELQSSLEERFGKGPEDSAEKVDQTLAAVKIPVDDSGDAVADAIEETTTA